MTLFDENVVLVGCKDAQMGQTLKELMQMPYFRMVLVDDEETVELCGALKVSVTCQSTDGITFVRSQQPLNIKEHHIFEHSFYCQLPDFGLK